jgi:hypothetical protein
LQPKKSELQLQKKVPNRRAVEEVGAMKQSAFFGVSSVERRLRRSAGNCLDVVEVDCAIAGSDTSNMGSLLALSAVLLGPVSWLFVSRKVGWWTIAVLGSRVYLIENSRELRALRVHKQLSAVEINEMKWTEEVEGFSVLIGSSQYWFSSRWSFEAANIKRSLAHS